MANCKNCQRPLESDEIGIYKRLVHRGATEFLCLTCFAEKFKVTEEQLREKIRLFRDMGCTLFH